MPPTFALSCSICVLEYVCRFSMMSLSSASICISSGGCGISSSGDDSGDVPGQQYHSPQHSREQLGAASAKQSRHNEAELPQSAAIPVPLPIQPFHMGAPGSAGVSSGGTRRERGFQPKSKANNNKRLHKYLSRFQ